MPSPDHHAREQSSTGPFLVALLVLVSAVAVAHPVRGWLRIRQNKDPIALQKPLSGLDASLLAPYRVVRRNVLDATVIEALGTNQYLRWDLEDTSVGPRDPLRHVHLFVTYYTGGNDLVPHTPDVCYVGGGYQPAQPHENVDMEIPGVGTGGATVPIRVCTFAKTAVFNRAQLSVVYTFFCNGAFVSGRTGVRFAINDLSNRYAFFSKIEVSFPGATRALNVEGTRRLLSRVLPVLIEHHYPDFEAAERAARGHPSGATERERQALAGPDRTRHTRRP